MLRITPFKPLLYVITAVMRDANLGLLAESLRPASQQFSVRWLPIFDTSRGNDAAEKRNVGMRMIHEPGWIYFLDDDNLLHSDFTDGLKQAISKFPDTKVFFFPSYRIDGSMCLPSPTIMPFCVDTASYAVYSTACEGNWWSIAELPTPDYWWIKRVCDRGFEPKLLEAHVYYNALRADQLSN